MISENGPTFISKKFKQFLQRNGVRHTTLPPYHPTSNGLMERALQIFKRIFEKLTYGTVQTKIARQLFNYRITPQSTTGRFPSELCLGKRLKSTLDLIQPHLQER